MLLWIQKVQKSSVATQKFATALSRDNIVTAFNDVVAQNRMNVPYEIEINVDTFNDKTQDGEDEEEVLKRFEELIEQEKQQALSQAKFIYIWTILPFLEE